MKYTITMNQKVLANSTLDLTDCAILDWLITICNSKSDSIDQNRVDGMTWIDYKNLLKDMPLLRIKSTGALTPRFKRIEKNGYIKCKVIRGPKGHTKMHVCLEDKVDSLFIEKTPFTEMNRPVHLNESGPVHLNEPIIILGTNHYTNDQDIYANSKNKDISTIEKSFNLFWSTYPKKENKAKAKDKWFKKDFYKEIDKILGFIEEAKKTDRWKKGYIKDPVTFLNNQTWCDDLAGYYDRSSSPQKVYKDDKGTDYNKRAITLEN